MKLDLPDLVGLPCPRCRRGKIVEHSRTSRRLQDGRLVSILVSVCCYSCNFYVNPTWHGAPGLAAPTAHERITLARSLAEERDAGRHRADPDPIEIISPNPNTSTLEGRIYPARQD